jgi:signal transduction histidine kinase
MAEIRNFIEGLESQVMQGGDFANALETMVQTMSAASATVCRLSIQDAAVRHISTEQALHLMNVVREAVSNSLRHGRAKRTTVSLKLLTRSIRLSVSDDGAGFNQTRVHGRGHGLPNMAARARKLGGRFAVRSKPGLGTKILLDLPKEELNACH